MQPSICSFVQNGYCTNHDDDDGDDDDDDDIVRYLLNSDVLNEVFGECTSSSVGSAFSNLYTRISHSYASE